ncbi:MAG: hypothetical protein HZA47_04160 [Planctomycetes bacterium]|uniref:hypothetical protein n=1 Tax=Candidatus Wunengus sp. YC65 TaxID=3367701 RepID=UPI001E0C6A91|nr:hypothetical protein [Planctomycetota bacterium]
MSRSIDSPPEINKNDLHPVKDNEKLRSGKVKLDETFGEVRPKRNVNLNGKEMKVTIL